MQQAELVNDARGKNQTLFCYSVSLILLTTGIAKIVSGAGSAQILQNSDPIFLISFRVLFWVAGLFELAVALFCLFSKRVELWAGLVAWLSTSILAYRIGLVWIGYHRPCRCLGNLTDAIHLSPQMADNVIRGVLVYLFIGSYTNLFWVWRKRKRLFAQASE